MFVAIQHAIKKLMVAVFQNKIVCKSLVEDTIGIRVITRGVRNEI